MGRLSAINVQLEFWGLLDNLGQIAWFDWFLVLFHLPWQHLTFKTNYVAGSTDCAFDFRCC